MEKTSVSIIRPDGIEQIEYGEKQKAVIFSLRGTIRTKKERRAIGHALQRTGRKVYATGIPWVQDAYIEREGHYLSQQDFGEVAAGGNYVFGEGFVIVSSSIENKVHAAMESQYFRKFFGGAETVFIPPVSSAHDRWQEYKPSHIDITLGYIPAARLMVMDQRHFLENERQMRLFMRRHRLNILLTRQDQENRAHYYLANFFVVQENGSMQVVVNRYNNPLQHQNVGTDVIETPQDIIRLPEEYRGSVRCAANSAHSPKVWDAMDIPYQFWGRKS
ncbi:hypothetical protein HY491_01840 [Candidatus Woesearchaeota archaeon]|nr:hypothetical protein [Candidatus Woesearchaeota archaeon]